MKIPLDHKKDKELLINLCKALNVSERNLHRDKLDYWNIFGRRGWIDTDSVYWYIHVSCKSRTIWQNVKQTLFFMVLWVDGEAEGILRLQRYPSEEEAQKIRKMVGISQSWELSEKRRNELKLQLHPPKSV